MTSIDQIAELVGRATKGPWRIKGVNQNLIYSDDGFVAEVHGGAKGGSSEEARTNTKLIVAAVSTYTELAARLIAAEGMLKVARAWRRAIHHGTAEDQDIQQECLLMALVEFDNAAEAILTASAEGAGR